jgi:hypothetical protein
VPGKELLVKELLHRLLPEYVVLARLVGLLKPSCLPDVSNENFQILFLAAETDPRVRSLLSGGRTATAATLTPTWTSYISMSIQLVLPPDHNARH